MPELEWNEQDFIECLAVIPEVEDEYKVSHSYRVCRSGLCLSLIVRQIESMVQVSLSREGAEEPVMDFALAVRGPVRYRNEKWGEYLEFHDCLLVADRFSYLSTGDLFDRIQFPHGQILTIAVAPEIRIRINPDWRKRT